MHPPDGDVADLFESEHKVFLWRQIIFISDYLSTEGIGPRECQPLNYLDLGRLLSTTFCTEGLIGLSVR